MTGQRDVKAVVIGASAGGLEALGQLLSLLPENLPVPLLIVQHLHPQSATNLHDLLASRTKLRVMQAEEKKTPEPGTVYLAPPNYHLLVELDTTLSLSVDEPVHFSRPSVDVLFESAAQSWGKNLVGVILTGASSDGSAGLARIKDMGGYCIVQDPASAQTATMPHAAIAAALPDEILPLNDIGQRLIELCSRDNSIEKGAEL